MFWPLLLQVRGKGWFGLTERCMSLAAEWTVSAEIMTALAGDPGT